MAAKEDEKVEASAASTIFVILVAVLAVTANDNTTIKKEKSGDENTG